MTHTVRPPRLPYRPDPVWPQQVHDRHIDLSFGRTHYLEAGPEDGPIILCVHGLGAWAEHWIHQLRSFANEGFRVIAPDLIGHGSTAAPRVEYTPEVLSGFLAEFSDALGLSDITLVGNSLGAGICVVWAEQEPEKMNRAFLNAVPGLGRWVPFAYRALQYPLVGKLLSTRSAANTWLQWRSIVYNRKLVTWKFCQAVVRYKRSVVAPHTYRSIVSNLVDKSGPRYYVVDELKKLPFPVQLIWGEIDQVIPKEQGKQFCSENPHIPYLEIPRTGHIPMMERPFAFNRLLREFIATS